MRRMKKRMNAIFSQKEINTGRQQEFDHLKGIFMLFIYLIHAFQATLSPEDLVTRWLYMFATMSGAAIFIFVMGIGTVYSRNTAPAAFVKSGLRMVVYQYLDNIAYVAALLIPYPFVAGGLSRNGLERCWFLARVYIQYTNIFFITGIIYLVLALLKKLDVKTIGYVVIGVAAGISAPLLYGTPVNVPVAGYLVRLLIGEADFVSFTPIYFLSYALFGVAFGKLLRRVEDKAGFYRILAVASSVIVVVWWALVFGRYGSDLTEMMAVLSAAYTCPDLWHVAASLAHILLFAAVFFYIGESRKKRCGPDSPVARQILYYSGHISKYYALHVPVYLVVLGCHGYESFQGYQCWLLALLSMFVTELMVRGYNYFLERRITYGRRKEG